MTSKQIKPANYPCWLSKQQLQEAEALIKLGFEYREDSEDLDTGRKVGSLDEWEFYDAETCDFALDAFCNGAMYSWILENESDLDDMFTNEEWEKWFGTKIDLAKFVIVKVQQEVTTTFTQLSLF